MNTNILGLGLLVLAGGMNGSFTLPMKFTQRWAWENTWLVHGLCPGPVSAVAHLRHRLGG